MEKHANYELSWIMKRIYYMMASFKYLKLIYFPMLFMSMDFFLRAILVKDYSSLPSVLMVLTILFGMASAINYKSIIDSDNKVEFRIGIQLTIFVIWVIIKVLNLLVLIPLYVNVLLGVFVLFLFYLLIMTVCKHNRDLINKDYIDLYDSWVITNQKYKNIDPITGAVIKEEK